MGFKERLLCAACEEKFSKHEVYVRELLYGTQPAPLKKLLLGTSLSNDSGHDLLLDLRKVVGVDYAHLKLFQMSVLWRASVASGRFFRNVSLGATHEPKVRALLKNDTPGLETDYSCVMIDLRHNGLGWEDWIQQPLAERDTQTKQRIYKIIMGGYMYLFHVSNMKPPAEAADACVKCSGEMLVPVAKAEGIMSFWAKALRQAGKL